MNNATVCIEKYGNSIELDCSIAHVKNRLHIITNSNSNYAEFLQLLKDKPSLTVKLVNDNGEGMVNIHKSVKCTRERIFNRGDEVILEVLLKTRKFSGWIPLNREESTSEVVEYVEPTDFSQNATLCYELKPHQLDALACTNQKEIIYNWPRRSGKDVAIMAMVVTAIQNCQPHIVIYSPTRKITNHLHSNLVRVLNPILSGYNSHTLFAKLSNGESSNIYFVDSSSRDSNHAIFKDKISWILVNEVNQLEMDDLSYIRNKQSPKTKTRYFKSIGNSSTSECMQLLNRLATPVHTFDYPF